MTAVKNGDQSTIQTALKTLVDAMVSKRDEVVIVEQAGRVATVYSITTSHKDYGRIIGTGAKNFKAMQIILKLMAARQDREARLSVVQPLDPSRPKEERFRANPNWGKDEILPMVRMVCGMTVGGGAISINVPDAVTATVEISIRDDEELFIIEGQDRIPVTLRDFGDAVKTIFYAIGKNHGKNLYIDVVPVTYPDATTASVAALRFNSK